MRRVVTGHDLEGRAIVLSDAPATTESASPTRRAINLWFTDESPARLTAGEAETVDRPYSIVPVAGGTAFRIYELPPDEQALAGRSAQEIREGFERASGGNFATGKASHPLMHRTETIDYGIVLSGEVVLLMDDTEVHLRQGDVIVQRGTNHAWSNRSNDVCRMAFVVIDARLEPQLAASLSSG